MSKTLFLWLIMYSLVLCQSSAVFAQEVEEEDGGHDWMLAAGGRYMSKFTVFGRDLGQDRPAMLLEGTISHASGLSLGAGAAHVFGIEGQFQQSSLLLGYEFSFSDDFSASAEFSRYFYANDSLNVLAAYTHSLSLGADLRVGIASLDVSFERYFGGGGANQLVVGLSTYGELGDISILPLIQASFVSQSVPDLFLKSNKEKKGGAIAGTTTVAGLSSILAAVSLGYPLGQGFRLSLMPAYIYAPTELAAHTSQLIWSAGLRYSLDF